MAESIYDFQGTERFRIRRRLGAGGMGIVYEVDDQLAGGVVALKTLRHAEGADLFRFKREFRALADISHPNVISLYELFADGQHWFFTMELVEGVDFLGYVSDSALQGIRESSRHLKRSRANPELLESAGSMILSSSPGEPAVGQTEGIVQFLIQSSASADQPWSHPASETTEGPIQPRVYSPANLDALRPSLRQLSEGVCALHAAGILHRDIKPSNVLVTTKERVVLLDFGLVKELGSLDQTQSLTAVVGTPAYMAPEQAARRSVSQASDWYAVGVMLYQALTGKLPFSGKSLLDVMIRKQQGLLTPASELVVGVPEDLDELCRELLQTDPEARPTGAEVLSRLSQSSAPRRATVASAVSGSFVGREPHLARLEEALRAVKGGETVAVTVHGSSGLGKSTFIRHFLDKVDRSEKGAVVLVGRCYQQESVPYKALDSLMDSLTQYLKDISNAEAEALMPRDCAALERLFPVLDQVEAFAGARRRVLQVPDSHELRRRAFAALRELLSRLADRRLLILFIDDLQWGDVDSAALLHELLRPPDPPVLLLIACFRSEEVTSSPLLRILLPSLVGLEGTQLRDLEIGELTADEALQLARELLRKASPEQAGRIARESGGNPLFIGELARHAQQITSSTVTTRPALDDVTLDTMIQDRVSSLPEEAKRLLEMIAVAGQPLDFSIARQAVGPGMEAKQALATLRSSHLIRTRGAEQDEIETYHDRIRETVCAHIDQRQLKFYHQRLAELMENSKTADAETLAVHYSGAGDRVAAARYAALAASKASEALAFDRSARLYQFALEMGPAVDDSGRRLRILLGDALANAGRGAEAAAAYLAASRESAAAESLELQRQAAEQLLRSGHIDQGLAVLRTVLPLMGMKLAKTPARALMSLMARRAYSRVRGLRFKERRASQISAEELRRVDTCWSVAVGFSMVDVIPGSDFQVRHLLLALKTGEPARVARALVTEAAYVAIVGVRARRRVDKLLQEAYALAERINQPDALGRARLAAGISAYLTGRWREAVQVTSIAEEILREQCTGVAWERNTAHHFSLMARLCLGEWKEVARRLPTLLKEAEERGDLLAEANLGTRMSYILLLADDQAERAREQWREGLGSWSRRGFLTQHYYDLLRQGEIALYAATAGEGWQFVTERWPALRRSLILHIQTFRIEALHLRGRLSVAAALETSDSAQTATLARDAERCARRLARDRTVWSQAASESILAGIATLRGRKKEALDLLASAQAGFEASEMALYAASVRRQRGVLLGGDEGRLLLEAGDSWMRNQQIKNCERIASMLVPGRWDH